MLMSLFAFCLQLASAPAQSSDSGKASLIFMCAKTVSWPAQKFRSNTPFVIGVIGQDTISDKIQEQIGGKRVKDRTVEVKTITSTQEIAGCHVLFVSRSEAGRLGPIIKAANRASVLTIGDSDNFEDAGGAIMCSAAGFHLNLGNLDDADLTADSVLKERALKVKGK